MTAEIWVIYSPSEYLHEGAGFWSDEDGWTNFEGATRYPDPNAALPCIGVQCQWLGLDGQRDYSVLLGRGGERFRFSCFAEDQEHALEQARNAYPGEDVLEINAGWVAREGCNE